ncbi:MAG: sulfate adenylyltransferase [Fimbriimonadaceae bacterium]|nr:sulfate adenylyltransferase [Fimbriimonadaceae bacterium]
MSTVLEPTTLIAPYGGKLVDLRVQEPERTALIDRAKSLPSIQLTPRSMCDLELLAVGAFSPLDRFMGKADYESVLKDMKLADGTLWPMPITLPIPDESAFQVGQEVVLRSTTNAMLAVMKIEEIWTYDPKAEQQAALGTTDAAHPLVSEMTRWGKAYASGPLRVLNLPTYYDFTELRRTPSEVRDALAKMGSKNVVAFQTRNPLHRAHEELTKRAQKEVGGSLLIHPVVGVTKPGDVDHFTRVRAYKALVDHHYDDHTLLSLLPLAMRMAGPREAVWHAIIRRNYGVTHFIVGRDHAGPGKDSTGKPFYGPYEAQDLVKKVAEEIGVKAVPFYEMVYLADEDRYEEAEKVPAGATVKNISGTQVRDDYLAAGNLLPEWFTRKEVAKVLADAYPPKNHQGFCLWFTGLPSAGKSTIADIVALMLMEYGRQVSVLDGDVVRTHLSKGLGFSKEDRDTNILRIGYVASEITKHEGAVICAAVSPYTATRNQVRNLVGGEKFIEIFVDTPLSECETRDLKGIYAKARRGEMTGVTGIDDPYEAPANPEIRLTTLESTPEQNAKRVIEYLLEKNLIVEA